MSNEGYIAGDHWLICEFSGFKIRRSQARRTHDGRWVRSDFWEPEHPQENVRARPERMGVDVARPRPADVFLDTNDVTAESL